MIVKLINKLPITEATNCQISCCSYIQYVVIASVHFIPFKVLKCNFSTIYQTDQHLILLVSPDVWARVGTTEANY